MFLYNPNDSNVSRKSARSVEVVVHRMPLNAQQSSVGPILCQRLLSGKSFGLRDLCFVMWKDQLRASAMQIVGGPKMGECYRGVFDVPARSSLAPWAVPGNLSRLLIFPEDEVARVPLFRIRIDPMNC